MLQAHDNAAITSHSDSAEKSDHIEGFQINQMDGMRWDGVR